MSTSPDSPAADNAADSSGGPAARRIPIGTQRPGVKPPSLAPKYEYVTPAAPAAPQVPPAPQQAGEAVTAPPLQAESPVPATPPTTTPGSVREDGPKREQGSRGRRDRRRDEKPQSFTDVMPPARRVAVPNIRAALDEELEADFEAALGGLAVDDLLAAGATAKAETPLEPGTRVMATVLSIGPDTAFVDLGGRRQGAMKLAGIIEAGIDIPAIGDSIEVAVGSRNEDDNLYDVALGNRAIAVEDWSQIQNGMIVEARVVAANKGGLECEVAGLRGFMPASLVSTWRIENFEEMIGQTLDSLVTEIVPEARRLVLSRRAVIEKQAADAKAKLLETLEPGTELDGVVRSVRDFGAFVDIGDGVEGLVHVSELASDRRVRHARDVVNIGQDVEVVVLEVDPTRRRISLSMKQVAAQREAADVAAYQRPGSASLGTFGDLLGKKLRRS